MPPDGSAQEPISTEQLYPLWDLWRAGRAVPCPREACTRKHAAMALAVDAASQAYRLVCVDCGCSSLWFETASSGIQIRTGTSSYPAPRPGLSED